MKRGWKILLFIILGFFIILILGILYFLFIFKFSANALCLSETNMTDSKIACASKQSCYSVLNETLEKEKTKAMDKYARGPTAELYTNYMNVVFDKIIYCDGTCKVKRIYHLANADDSCIGNDEKIVIELSGMQILKIYLRNDGEKEYDTINSPLQESTNNTGCVENWNCTDWSDECVMQRQRRTCIDLNDCGTITRKLLEGKYCEPVYTGECDEAAVKQKADANLKTYVVAGFIVGKYLDVTSSDIFPDAKYSVNYCFVSEKTSENGIAQILFDSKCNRLTTSYEKGGDVNSRCP